MRASHLLIASLVGQILLTGCNFDDDKALKSGDREQKETLASAVGTSREEGSDSFSSISYNSIEELKKGMVYGRLRKIVISGGWKPRQNPDCKKDLVGRNFEEICSSNPNLCEHCDSLPELSECSADGHCLSEFVSSDGKQLLKVATYGEIGDAKVEERDRGLPVSWWNVEEIKK